MYCLASLFLTPIAALAPVVIIGAAKEVYDKYTKKVTPDIIDLLYTVGGALPVLLTNIIK